MEAKERQIADQGSRAGVEPVAESPLSAEELEQQEASELPDREAMSLVNANVAIPVNAAVAANVLSDNAVATADAAQNVPIDQSTGPR